MIKTNIFLLFFMLLSVLNYSQSNLKILFEKLNFSETDQKKDSINRLILETVENKFNEADFSEFENIRNLSFLISPDKKFMIATWPIMYSGFTYKYSGFIRYYEKDFGRFSVEKLTDNQQKTVNPEMQTVNPKNWYGALYYKLIYKKYKKEKIYVLLGWDGYTDLSTRKIIDVFYLNENEEPEFGKDIFEYEDGLKKRLIFEYKEGISMNLNYDDKKKLIIWDHLSPSKPELKGHYEYYGPDLSFDALYYDKGIWKYIPDADLNK
jgi:hypothetical protein